MTCLDNEGDTGFVGLNHGILGCSGQAQNVVIGSTDELGGEDMEASEAGGTTR